MLKNLKNKIEKRRQNRADARALRDARRIMALLDESIGIIRSK